MQATFYSIILVGVLGQWGVGDKAMEDRSESEEVWIGKDKANQSSF